MAVSPEFRKFVEEQLSVIGPVSVRRMFGGAGVFADGVMFALIADDELYLKGDATTAEAFQAEGCAAFSYVGKSKPIQLSYWRCPERLFDDPVEMEQWARGSLGIALENHRSRPPRKSSRP